MSKQRRSRGLEPPDRELLRPRAAPAAERAPGAAPGLGERRELLAAPEDAEGPAHPLLPMVERAMLALQIVPRATAEHARFVEVIERSRLPEARKRVLLERIEGDQEAALGVRGALVRWFATDTAELRGALDEVLEALWARLGGSVAPDGRPLPASWGALGAELDAQKLDTWLAGEPAEGPVGGFCRSIASLWLWTGEEEEEEDPVEYPVAD